MKRAALLLLASAVLAVGAAGCPSKDSGRTIRVDDRIELEPIWLSDLPANADTFDQQAAVCGSGVNQTFVLRLDTAATPNGWDRNILIGGNHDLVGCGDTPWSSCSPNGRNFEFRLSGLSRVALEGISVDPTGIWDRYDVVCRGVADAAVRPADIQIEGGVFVVTLRMAAVGASNPLRGGPAVRWAAAVSLSDPTTSVGMEAAGPRGRVVIAGGLDTSGQIVAGIHEFDPATLTFAQTAVLTTAVAGLAGSLLEIEGVPNAVFTGGAGSDGLAVDNLAAYETGTGLTVEEELFPFGNRVFHETVTVPDPDADHRNLALVGGAYQVDWDDNRLFESGGTLPTRPSVWVPEGGQPPSWASAGSDPVFYNPDAAGDALAHNGYAGILRVGDRVLLASGGEGDTIDTTPLAPSDVVDAWDPSTGTFENTGLPVWRAMGMVAAVVDTSQTADLTGRALFAGGIECSFEGDCTTAASTARVGSGAAISLRVPRAFARATTLRDRRVLITGGVSTWPAEQVLPLEAYHQAEQDFLFEPRPRGDSCDPLAGGAACAELLRARHGHTATRLDGTRTWLDGAVLLVGGIDPLVPGPAAELYVPAYRCGGIGNLQPLAPDGDGLIDPSSSDLGLLLCDRGRGPEPITNPRTGEIHRPPSR